MATHTMGDTSGCVRKETLFVFVWHRQHPVSTPLGNHATAQHATVVQCTVAFYRFWHLFYVKLEKNTRTTCAG